MLGIQCSQITEHNAFERTLGHIGMDHLIALQAQAVVSDRQPGTERLRQRGMNGIPHLMDGIDIGHLEQLGQGSLPRQRQISALRAGSSAASSRMATKAASRVWDSSTPCPCWTRATPSITALLISIWAASQRANSLRHSASGRPAPPRCSHSAA